MPARRPLPRFALLLLLALLASGAVGAIAIGADPDSGTVSLENTQTGWQGADFPAGGNTIVTTGCNVPGACDEFELTADIDPAHWDTHKGGAEVVIAWEDPNDDYDLRAYDKNGDLVASSLNISPGTSERIVIDDANRDAGPYRILVNPYAVGPDSTYNGGVLVISRAEVAADTGDVPLEPVSDLPCVDGLAGGIFPCKDIDLAGFLPVSVLNDGETEDSTGTTVELNDIWGWTDPETEREYAVVGKTNGTAFVDITEPTAPVYLGSLPSSQRLSDEPVQTIFNVWRDVKVYENHAFVVSEEPSHGMQVFDLTRLRGVTEPQTWDEDALYQRVPTVPGHLPNPQAMGNSHNIAINEDSGFAYVIGTDTCEGGPHMIDIRDPKNPEFAGCVAEDGYTHDTQCVNYDGPDERFAGREICFNANEDTLTIVDVTDKSAPVQLARLGYDGAEYTHQGWLTEDQRYFLLNDELDEQNLGIPTTTKIFDVARLDSPAVKASYDKGIDSIDHNLYTRGNDVFEANYRSGLRWLDAAKAGEGALEEKGFFDVYPADDDAEFNGAWSNFPYYDSGVVVVSGIEQGLFVLWPGGKPDPAPAAPGGGTDGGTPTGDRGGEGPTAGTSAACAASKGLKSVKVERNGRGLRLGFERGANAPVDVDVFRQSRGRRIGLRLVARFTGRSETVRWNGRANRRKRRVTNGVYFVRFRMRTQRGTDTHRVTVRRKRGRFMVRPTFHRPLACDLLAKYKLRRPVFGGRKGKTLGIAFRVARSADVDIVVTRKGKTIRTYDRNDVPAGKTQRVRLSPKGLRRGEYRVRLVARSGGDTVESTLRSRKL